MNYRVSIEKGSPRTILPPPKHKPRLRISTHLGKRSAPVPVDTSAPLIAFSLTDAGEITASLHLSSRESLALPVHKVSQSGGIYVAAQDISGVVSGLSIHCYTGQVREDPLIPTISTELISLPFIGLVGKDWSDGWVIHTNQANRIVSAAAPGPFLRLCTELGNSTKGITLQECVAKGPSLATVQRHVVATMLQATLDHKTLAAGLAVAQPDQRAACQLTLLRQAFPQDPIRVALPGERRGWLPRFKNFLECIDADPCEESQTKLRKLEACFTPVCRLDWQAMAQEIDRDTRILAGLPQSLDKQLARH